MTAFAFGAKWGGRVCKSYTRGPASAAVRRSPASRDAKAAPCKPLPIREKKSLRDGSFCIVLSIDIGKFGGVQQFVAEAGQCGPASRGAAGGGFILILQM